MGGGSEHRGPARGAGGERRSTGTGAATCGSGWARLGRWRLAALLVALPLLAACPPAETRPPEGGGAPTDSSPLPPLAYPDLGASTPAATPAGGAPAGDAAETPQLTWQQRLAIDIDGFKRDDALLYMKVRTAIPDDDDPNDPAFIALLTRDRRSAAVILARLLSRSEPVEARIALAEQLPFTRGDWDEGASVLIRLDPDAAVRKALVGTMRFAKAPHASAGLANGLRDEEAEVRAAAARIAGFQPDAATIEGAMVECLLGDSEWEARAAIARSFGALGLRSAFSALIGALGDRDPRVRIEALRALERIDPTAAAATPEVREQARSRDSRVAEAARRILRAASAESGAAGR